MLAACNRHPVVETVETWQIEYKVSGGFAGIMQGLSIQSDGRYRIYDKKRHLTRRLNASPAQISSLAEQLERIAHNPHQQKAAKLSRKHCADCITQQVLIDYKNSRFTYKFRTGLPRDPSYHVLLKQLSTLLNQGLAGQTP